VARGDSHTFSPSAKHICNVFLGHSNLSTFNAIMTQKQPSAEALFDGVKTIANGSLGDLGD